MVYNSVCSSSGGVTTPGKLTTLLQCTCVCCLQTFSLKVRHVDDGVAQTVISNHDARDVITDETKHYHDYHSNDNHTLSTQLLYEILQQLRRRDAPAAATTAAAGESVHDDDVITTATREWELVAMVLDRVFLLCYLIASIITSATILLGRH